MTHLMNTYNRLPVAFTHGKGARLYDADGREYLDALAGIAVNGLGHGHPKLVAALAGAGRATDPYVEPLSRHRAGAAGRSHLRTVGHAGGVFRQFGIRGQRGRPEARADVRSQARRAGSADHRDGERVHGRTLATLAATGSEKARKGFDPMPSGSSAFRTTTSSPCRKRPMPTRGCAPSGSRCCRAKAASRSPTSSSSAACVGWRTSAAGC